MMFMACILARCLVTSIFFKYCFCSAGDSSHFYQNCLKRCSSFNCTDDGTNFMYRQQNVMYYLKWSCEDECKYECMWKTVKAFKDRNWKTPQFYGKWPFVRVMGIQEPASVAFSLLNAYCHFRMLKKFRNAVRPDSPLTWLWHVYFLVCVHAWFWSAVFHTRDFH
nr:unnamed protein product [Callosobruchus chinensis]